MPIVGFNFTKLQAEKQNIIKEDTKIQINSKLGIKSVSKEKLPTGKTTKSDGLKFDFEFSLIYNPEIATINIEGYIYYLDDQDKIKTIISEWEKKKDIPIDIKTQVLNTVVLKATIRALSLEQEINVPPHIPFPSIRPVAKQTKGKGKEDYIG